MLDARQLAAARDASRVAFAAFERVVEVWDLDRHGPVASFETILDFGGDRLALSDDGRVAFAASYDEGVAAYRCDAGELIWRRSDIKRPQRVHVSRTSPLVYVGCEEAPCLALNADDGATAAMLRGVEEVITSLDGSLTFVDRDKKRPALVANSDFSPFFEVERTTFAFLDVAFGRGRIAVSESTGAVRCFDVPGGREIWRHVPRPGTHCLDLEFSETIGSFVGVLLPYQRGGDRHLVVFDKQGSPSTIAQLGDRAHNTCFLERGTKLLTSLGDLFDVSSGERRTLTSP